MAAVQNFESTPESVDVIVCGAGPVGLFFAYQMLTLGHSVYLCDYKSGPTDQSRAILLTSRTVETLSSHRIANSFLERAVVLQGIQPYADGKKLNTVSVSGDTPYPQLTCLIQNETEQVFVDLLTKKGFPIHWETEMVSYSQDDHGVEAVVRPYGSTDSSLEKRMRGQYIIGADGCHSRVRKHRKDWTYDGEVVNSQFILADVVVAGPDATALKNQRLNVFASSDGVCGFLPIGTRNGKAYYRVIASDEADPAQNATKTTDEVTHGIDNSPNRKKPTLQDIQTIIDTRVGRYKIKVEDPIWISVGRVNERHANGFRRGRAFLVGDAAHCHSPLGGQGMNIGLQDAENLAWKLSLVLKHQASDPESLLDSYSTERLPIAKSIIELTGRLTRAGLSRGVIISRVRLFLMSIVFSITSLTQIGIRTILQLYTRIDEKSPLLVTSTKRLFEAGLYIPESGPLMPRALRKDVGTIGSRATLREVIACSGHKTTLLWVATRPSYCDACPWTAEFWRKAAEFPADTIHPVVIESNWHAQKRVVPDYVPQASREAASANFWLESSLDGAETVTSRIGLYPYLTGEKPPAALVVIRPDLYVAHSHLIYSPQDIDVALRSVHYIKRTADV